jgi:hypothetical protein
MDVYFDTPASEAERSEVERWRTTNEAADIEYVSIEKPSVVVHGSTGHFVAITGTARRRGKLAGELDDALALMRDTRCASTPAQASVRIPGSRL